MFRPDKSSTTGRVALREMPLVAAQPGIWVADQLSPHANAYAVAHYVDLQGPVDERLLCRAILQGLQEADTLCMVFAERDGVPLQWLDPAKAFEQPRCLDLRNEVDPEAAVSSWMQADLQGDLRLLGGQPLICHALLRIADQRWFWYQRYHHLQVDGFSFTAITRRMASLYTALVQGNTAEPNPFTPFAEVVDEYLDYQQSAAFERDAAFWSEYRKQLPSPASISTLPLAGQQPSTRLLRQWLDLDAAQFGQLVAQGQAHKLSAPDLAFALLAVWLTRLSNAPELAAGFIFMRRMGSAALSATGPVINVLPMALRAHPEQNLVQVATGLAAELKRLRRHQRYEAEQVMRDWGSLNADQPLYGPVLNLKMFDFELDLGGIQGITHHLAAGPVRDLELAIYLGEQGECRLEVLANAERYDAATLNRHLQRLQRLLQQFVTQPDLACGDAGLLDASEATLLARVNATDHPLPDATLASLLAEQAARTPEAPALADESCQLTYQQMQQQVLALAEQLIKQGVRSGDVVAVALPRSVQLSLALQAIVMVGAAYLPLDTGYPDERLHWMLDDARPRLLITETRQIERFSGQGNPALLVYEDLLPEPAGLPVVPWPDPEQTAYIIFTSGSTGRPKGVMVSHRAIVNRLLWMQDHYRLVAGDVVLQKTPSSFDVSVWEFFWPLLVGAQLVMAPPEAHRDPEALQALFARWQVTTTHFVPSMLAAFVDALKDEQAVGQCRSLRQVFCSGEALSVDLARDWERRTSVPLHNLYGPTEAAVDVSWYPAFGDRLAVVQGSSVPIGFPVWNTGLRILDARLQPVPLGVPGDLYLTGVQLAQGYLGRPDLTASRFVADPLASGQRMYRTGDVARWLDHGAVEYLGRSDDQVKIRGQRIELDEIDQALRQLQGVRQAVCHARVLGQAARAAADERQLVGYLVLEEGMALDIPAFRQQLAQHLPAHMLPVTLMPLDSLPLSANGKLDRKALPAPVLASTGPRRAPATALEQRLAQAFADLLGCPDVSAEDDFFALGGHSLLAMRLAARLRRELDQPVTVGQIMVASTVAALAEQLGSNRSEAERQRQGFESLLPLRRSAGPTLFCFHPASGFAWQFSVLLRYLDADWSITGIQSPHPNGPMSRATDLDQVSEAHYRQVRATQPQGPYFFIGYSLGGTLAQAVASRLQADGEQVAFLGLLDTWPPETQNWDEKQGQRALDPEVLAELDRERAAFLKAMNEGVEGADADQSAFLFDQIEANYATAVRLLQTARSRRFEGEATLFVAQKTLPDGMDVQQVWKPWVASLRTLNIACAHVDILAPEAFKQVGPLLNERLNEQLQSCLATQRQALVT